MHFWNTFREAMVDLNGQLWKLSFLTKWVFGQLWGVITFSYEVQMTPLCAQSFISFPFTSYMLSPSWDDIISRLKRQVKVQLREEILWSIRGLCFDRSELGSGVWLVILTRYVALFITLLPHFKLTPLQRVREMIKLILGEIRENPLIVLHYDTRSSSNLHLLHLHG